MGKMACIRRAAAILLTCVMTIGMMSGCGKKDSTYKAKLPTGVEEADIYVEAIEGLPDNFIKGMDVSSVIAEEASGVKYYDKDGKEQDLFKILADSGVNYIRVRVWNDPYDSKGNGYGGGNNDVAKAVEIGKRAAQYGMKLLVDFHYSDFWADPKKQQAPKAWAHLTFADKQEAIYNFTLESLNTIKEGGADIGMVQIGNEINNGMSGETDETKIATLLSLASKAVREFSKDVQVAVHYTNVDDQKGILRRAQMLADNNVDYDIFGVSYYTYWHGSFDNMKATLTAVTEQFGKKTCIMETSYAYTLEDGDVYGNSVGESDLIPEYGATVQSQATCIRDVMAAANEVGALGIFYWEGAWVPVGNDYESNAAKWEEFGSGWASSYAGKYDPNDAGQYYGGCSWDNQAFFDFNGKVLPSLDVFKYVNYGTTCEQKIDYLLNCIVNVNVGDELVMPEKFDVVFNNRAENDGVKVTWDAAQVAAIDTNVMADYTIDGTLEDGTKVTAKVKVAKLNYVLNPSFEENKLSMWNVTYDGENNPTDFQTKSSDALTGDVSFHFYSTEDFCFTIEQQITGLTEGEYTFNVNIQGGDIKDGSLINIYVIADGERYESDPVTLTGWVNWQTPEIKDIKVTGGEVTVGVYVKAVAKGWGTMDDFYLYKQ